MPQPNTVVQPVKARADPQPFAHRAKPQTKVGMLKTLAQLGNGHNRYELARPDTNQLRDQHHRYIDHYIVEQMVAVVAPHGHLALCVVQRMQSPPPFNLVLATVDPVTHKIKHHQVNQEADDGDVGHAGPELINVKRTVSSGAQRSKGLVKPRIQRKKQRQPEHAQPMNQRVQNIGANGGTVSHRINRPPAL